MKIAVLAHLKYPIVQPFAGGLEMHTHLLVRALRRRGHAVTLFAAAGSDPALEAVPVCPPTGDALGDPALGAAIDRAEEIAYRAMMEAVACGGFDLVHNNSLHDGPLRASAGLPAPTVTVLHTPPFARLAGGVAAAAPDVRFVAVSRPLARLWDGHGIDAEVVPNGIDLAAFAFRPAAAEPGYAVWSGRAVPEKGLHLAIDAARRAGLPLRIAGPRPDPTYWATRIAPRLGPDVTDLGHLAHEALAAQIGGARVAIVTPCWEEPFGLVVAEALACGTPVAAFARGAVPGILNATCGVLAPADAVAELADAIRAATTCDRRACRVRAEALFDVDTMTDGYEAIYRSALAEHGSRSATEADPLLDGAEA